MPGCTFNKTLKKHKKTSLKLTYSYNRQRDFGNNRLKCFRNNRRAINIDALYRPISIEATESCDSDVSSFVSINPYSLRI